MYKLLLRIVENNQIVKGEFYKMLDNILKLISHTWNRLVIFLSFLTGMTISQLGLNRSAAILILSLAVIDLFSKLYSLVLINYGKFTFKNYINAWKIREDNTRILSSNVMKHGIISKAVYYSIILFLSNKIGKISNEEIIGATVISSSLNAGILLTELHSVLENFGDISNNEAIKNLASLFKRKKESYFDKEK